MGWQDRAYNREENNGIPPVVFKFPKLTPLTLALIGSCFVIFVIQSATRSSNPLEYWGVLTFDNALAFKQPWRWITYQYLHGGGVHLFFNMLGIFFFLPALEQMWGWKKTLAFYTLGGIVGGALFGVLCLATGLNVPIIGASGSVFALLGGCALYFPSRQLILLVFPVPIRVAAGLFAALFLLTTIADRDFSNACHLGGLAFGFCAPWLAGPILAKQKRQFDRRRVQRVADAEKDEQVQVDAILSKVSAHGMHSLTWMEKRALRKATEHQRQRDREVAATLRRKGF